MARPWRKGFVLFVTLLILTTLWRVIIPSHEFGADTQRLNCSQVWARYEGWNANRQNVSLSHQPFMSLVEGQNRFVDWSYKNQTTTDGKTLRSPTPLQLHSPISIGSDADFAIQGWPGNGTQETPYSIRDLNITGGGYCIRIRNTRVHFVVTNCWLVWGQPSVTLNNATNGHIANTTFVNCDDSVQLILSESIELTNNTYVNTSGGISVYDSNSIMITNNTCISTHRGISVYDSNSIMITNNTCINADFGFMIFDSVSTKIINNTIKNSEYFGCEIYPVNDNILANNSLVNCGFFFGSWENMYGAPTISGLGSSVDVNAQITGNTVNQRPLILWIGRMGLTVPLGGGQVILLNCSSVTVQDQNLTNTSIGVFLCFTRFSRVVNNTCTSHSMNGIRIQNCEDTTVNNNLCTNNSISGITIDQTFDTILTENTCNYNTWGSGIHLFESYDNQLLDNICNHNRNGILLEPAFGTELLNNTCNYNQDGWYWYWYGGQGISITGDANTARQNLCNDNAIGIRINGFNNSVSENICTNNSYGILLQSDTTPISNNLCVNNRIGIYIYHYLETVIIDNIMVGCGLYITYRGSEWTSEVMIRGNRVNGRPLYFFKNQVNKQVPSGAGQIILFNCSGITVRGQILTYCSYGLLAYHTNHSLFADNVLGENVEYGIQLFNSHNNHFTRNIFTNNDARGIYLRGDCQNNTLEWNVFLCNASHDASDAGLEFETPGANIFDRNYWGNYSGYDLNFDGFGDLPYEISGSANNLDFHPLMTPIIVLATQTVERLLPLLESVMILIIVIIVFGLIRTKLKRNTPTSPNNLHSALT